MIASFLYICVMMFMHIARIYYGNWRGKLVANQTYFLVLELPYFLRRWVALLRFLLILLTSLFP